MVAMNRASPPQPGDAIVRSSLALHLTGAARPLAYRRYISRRKPGAPGQERRRCHSRAASPGPPAGEKKREKRTITEIRESKKTGEKMVYMSVPDYTSRQVGGDGGRRRGGGRRQPGHDRARPSLHHPGHHGHDGDARAGDPPRRAQHLRARLHALPELQHGRPRAHQRHALHAGGGLRRGEAAGRQSRRRTS